jgi:hypothetical protein
VPSWRQRARIDFGRDNGSTLTLTACSQRPAGLWDAYAGGLYLRTAAACVPVVFRIGNRSAAVYFSVGRNCG